MGGAGAHGAAAAAYTRVCVKNVPKHVNEARLKEHFAAQGEVTDVKLLRTSDGKSRQLAFLGFRSTEMATQAVKYFNNTYLDTSKLQVEPAIAIKAEQKPRAWSKHSAGSSAYQRLHKAAEPAAAADKQPATAGKKAGKHTKLRPEEEDPQLREFLEVMKPRQKGKLWSNDDTLGFEHMDAQARGRHATANGTAAAASGTGKKAGVDGRGSGAGRAEASKAVDGSDSDDDYQDMDVTGAGSDSDSHSHSDRDSDGASDDDEPAATRRADPFVADAGVSDLDYLKSRVRKNFSDDEDEADSGDERTPGEEEEEEEEQRDASGSRQGKGKRGVEAVVAEVEEAAPADKPSVSYGLAASEPEPGRLFVRNLSYGMTEEELTEVFQPFGTLSEVHLVRDRHTNQSKGLAYVQYEHPEEADAALEQLDKSEVQGRLIHLIPAQRAPKREEPPPSTQPGLSKFKAQREAALKATAGNKTAWNALFMRPDTVAAAVAARFGVTKGELLAPDAQDMAVRLALGETHVIADTKKALEDAGVDLELLERAAAAGGGAAARSSLARSGTTILVKNLPYEVTREELCEMFERFGGLGTLILPPTKTLALVDFLEAVDARRAFSACAYKRVGKVPIYLEWAPQGILAGAAAAPQGDGGDGSADEDDDDDAEAARTTRRGGDAAAAELGRQKGKASGKSTTDGKEASTSGQAAAAEDAAATLYVKNLSFRTATPNLLNHFKRLSKAGLLRAMVKTKPGREGKPDLSCGYGFVTYDTLANAKRAMAAAQASKLQNHTLQVQLSNEGANGNKGDDGEEETKGKAKGSKDSGTKMIVRNVAFEATKRDLSQLFAPFGQLKSLRMPRKFDGSHRGFAFIDFVTKKEAANAYAAVKNTHLHGRHLVLEYAKQDEALQDLRERTAMQFTGTKKTYKRELEEAADAPAPSRKAKFMKGLVEGDAFDSNFS